MQVYWTKTIIRWFLGNYLFQLIWALLGTAIALLFSELSFSELYAPFGGILNYILLFHLGVLITTPIFYVLYHGIKYVLKSVWKGFQILSMDSRLLKTKQLYDAGVLTEAEYEERLARIKAR